MFPLLTSTMRNVDERSGRTRRLGVSTIVIARTRVMARIRMMARILVVAPAVLLALPGCSKTQDGREEAATEAGQREEVAALQTPPQPAPPVETDARAPTEAIPPTDEEADSAVDLLAADEPEQTSALEAEKELAEATPRSLADELSRPPGVADVEADRATQEILTPLDESHELRPDLRAAQAFGPPPGATRLSKTSNLWVDVPQKRVYIDGYVTLREGFLEMFACPVGTKEHESIVAALAKSREVHAALLAVGATPGAPVRYDPEFAPPTGQSIRIWVLWRDADGQYHSADARQWVRNAKTDQEMPEDWVFGGSDFWKDPADGHEYYQADGGDMICVSNFSTAMLDVPFASSADADGLLFVPFSERIPDRETPVRLVLVPIPNDAPEGSAGPDASTQTTEPDQAPTEPDQAPTEEVLPIPDLPIDEQNGEPTATGRTG